MSSFKPLTDEQKITVSGVVIPSGESNFADFDRQVPGLQDGTNLFFDDNASGVIHLEAPTSGYPQGNPQGTLDSHLAFLFGESEYSNAQVSSRRRNNVDLSDFKPYIHYYPRNVSIFTSLYSSTSLSEAILIDYSFVFERSNYYNWYNYWGYNYPYGSIYDPGGNPVFDNALLIPPDDYIR